MNFERTRTGVSNGSKEARFSKQASGAEIVPVAFESSRSFEHGPRGATKHHHMLDPFERKREWAWVSQRKVGRWSNPDDDPREKARKARSMRFTWNLEGIAASLSSLLAVISAMSGEGAKVLGSFNPLLLFVAPFLAGFSLSRVLAVDGESQPMSKLFGMLCNGYVSMLSGGAALLFLSTTFGLPAALLGGGLAGAGLLTGILLKKFEEKRIKNAGAHSSRADRSADKD